MAVTLNEWLKLAGKDRAWYDSLPQKEQDRVDASTRNTPANQQLQAVAFTEPNDIAQQIDSAVQTLGVAEQDIARSRAEIASSPKESQNFSKFLSTHGQSRAWYDALPEDIQRDVLRVYESSSESGQVITSTSNEDARRALTTADKKVKERAQQQAAGTAAAGAELAASSLVPAPPEVAPGYPGGPGQTATPGGVIRDAYPVYQQPTTDDEILQQARLSTYDPFNLDPTFAQSPFVASGEQGYTMRGRAEFIGDRRVEGDAEVVNVGVFINGFATMSPAEISAWQKRLEKAGYLTAGDYQPGIPDRNSVTAMATAANQAQREQQSLLEVLSNAAVGEAKRLEAEKNSLTQKTKISFQEMAKDRYKDQLLATYMKTWGVAPPPGYIDAVAKEGVNWYEFEARERSKPAFRQSPVFQSDRISMEAQLAQEFGTLG